MLDRKTFICFWWNFLVVISGKYKFINSSMFSEAQLDKQQSNRNITIITMRNFANKLAARTRQRNARSRSQ